MKKHCPERERGTTNNQPNYANARESAESVKICYSWPFKSAKKVEIREKNVQQKEHIQIHPKSNFWILYIKWQSQWLPAAFGTGDCWKKKLKLAKLLGMFNQNVKAPNKEEAVRHATIGDF